MTASGTNAMPSFAAFRHVESRDGFEVVHFRATASGLTVEGHSTAVEEGEPFSVGYAIELDAAWLTRRATVRGQSSAGRFERVVEADGEGRWWIDGAERPELEGCLDLDLAASALTNAFPVHRLGLGVGDAAQAPAAFLRAHDLGIDRLEQRYERLADGDAGGPRFIYHAPVFDFRAVLDYDEHGLIVTYPHIAVRAA